MRQVVMIAVMLLVATSLSCANLESGSSSIFKKSEVIVPQEKTVLFNGKDFAGWKLYFKDPAHDYRKTWSIKDGVICCTGKPSSYMRTEKNYKNYLLHFEYRCPNKKGTSSGALVHLVGEDKLWPMSMEWQILSRWKKGVWEDKQGDAILIGKGPKWEKGLIFDQRKIKSERVRGARCVLKLKPDAGNRPVGQWNEYEIICKDNWMIVVINGVVQNVATGIKPLRYGKIALQSEGKPIEFRNIYIEPLE